MILSSPLPSAVHHGSLPPAGARTARVAVGACVCAALAGCGTSRRAADAPFVGEGEFGTIEKGKRADLVLLAETPLEAVEHLRRPLGVIVRGRWLRAEELETLLHALRVRPDP